MHVAVLQGCRFHFAQVKLSVRAGNREQFRSTRKKFRTAAFIRLDVGTLMANDAMEWSAKLGERQRIRGSSVQNDENFAFGLENFTRKLADSACPLVFPVGGVRVHVRLFERAPRCGS